MVEFSRRNLMSTTVAAALGASVFAGVASADEETATAPTVKGELKRLATTSLGAEVTGPHVFEDGTPLFSHQHPSHDNTAPYDRAGVGVIRNFGFELDGHSNEFEQLPKPTTEAEQSQVRAAVGEYEMLIREEDEINGNPGPSQNWGVAETPDGTPVDKFAGSRYSALGSDPDYNHFVPTNEEATEGYLFTNIETSPGMIVRTPLEKVDGEWVADAENAINLANTGAMRDLGGTRINCGGADTPWGTMVSSEENYGHPRGSLTASIRDIDEKGTGEGLRGGAEFFNRPNPSEIQQAVGEYYDDGWYVQGYWALTGVELLAYYLGAEPVDQEGFDPDTEDALDAGAEAAGSNTLRPIGDGYPNPYRYGYNIDFRNPTAEMPEPVKYWVMGRASWEAQTYMNDERTVYGCSDGDSKGIYKFVADAPIPSYDDPMDLSGTLYAPEITNADTGDSPAAVSLDVEWMELGHATNREVASWIAEYDDITQVDYLETHAETDWQEDLRTALEEADREVIENGNRDYITDEEMLEWARQFEEDGPDGVDEDLRRVPFLETRDAATLVGASIEFNKAEGVDAKDDHSPGDFVYFGVSEFNDDLSNDDGDIALQRVDGGVTYRGRIEADYNVSRLEPVVVGPDGTDTAAASDDDLLNIDNVYVMDDGRVLCCEDADQFGRSYPNDGLYVLTPNEMLKQQGRGPAFRDRDDDGTADPTAVEFEDYHENLDYETWAGLFE